MYYLYWGPLHWHMLASSNRFLGNRSHRSPLGSPLVCPWSLILILSKVINTPKWNPGKRSICLVWFLLLENHWNPYFIKLFKTFLNLSYSCQLLFLWSCSPLPQLSFTPMIAPKFRLINLDSDCQESMRRWTNKTCMNGYAVSCFFVLRHVFFLPSPKFGYLGSQRRQWRSCGPFDLGSSLRPPLLCASSVWWWRKYEFGCWGLAFVNPVLPCSDI